jgi:hypothetical protein
MEQGDITVTLTESQHELIIDIIMHSLESIQVLAPYDDGLHDLPLDNTLIQRYTMLDNLKETFGLLWSDRFRPES